LFPTTWCNSGRGITIFGGAGLVGLPWRASSRGDHRSMSRWFCFAGEAGPDHSRRRHASTGWATIIWRTARAIQSRGALRVRLQLPPAAHLADTCVPASEHSGDRSDPLISVANRLIGVLTEVSVTHWGDLNRQADRIPPPVWLLSTLGDVRQSRLLCAARQCAPTRAEKIILVALGELMRTPPVSYNSLQLQDTVALMNGLAPIPCAMSH